MGKLKSLACAAGLIAELTLGGCGKSGTSTNCRIAYLNSAQIKGTEQITMEDWNRGAKPDNNHDQRVDLCLTFDVEPNDGVEYKNSFEVTYRYEP